MINSNAIKQRCFSLLLFSLTPLTTFSSQLINKPSPLPVNQQPAAHLPLITPAAPHLSARSYVLMDANSGAILAEKQMDKRLPPASLTKLMTLYVTSQALAQHQINIDDMARVSKNAWSQGGSRMFLKENSEASIRSLIQGVIVASGNDACVTLSEYIGGTEQGFVAMMNQDAQSLGMTNSHFADSTGLPKSNHYTTAHDLARLTRALIKQYPQFYGWYRQKWINFNGIRQPNRNRLLWRDPSVDGLKTGHTASAGYCLISSAKRNGMRLIAVVMGTPSDAARNSESQALLNWGYRYYTSHQLFKAGDTITNTRVYFGKQNHTPLGLNQDLNITVPTGQYQNIHASMAIKHQIEAPITQNAPYGKIEIRLNNQLIAQAPLVALKNDQRAGLLSRTWDHLALFFNHIF